MGEAKFTPGPWAANTRRGSWDWLVYSVADPNIEICQPFHDGTEFNEVGEANSRLIAAAPDLLAALKAIQWFCDDPNGSEKPETLAEGLARLLPAARAAIAAATGANHEQ